MKASYEIRLYVCLSFLRFDHKLRIIKVIMVVRSLENLENLEKSGISFLVRENLENLEKSGNF